MTLVCANIGTLTQWYLVFGARARASQENTYQVTGTSWRHTKKLTHLSCGYLSVSWRLLLNWRCSFTLLYLMESSRISCWVTWKLVMYDGCHAYSLTRCYTDIAIFQLHYILDVMPISIVGRSW